MIPFETKNRPGLAKRQSIRFVVIRLCLLGCLVMSSLFLRAQAPVANFTTDVVSGCAPLVVHFTDQSSGNPVFWNWDLGNGQLSTTKNPVGTYTVPGTYSVTLVVRNADGIDAITKTDIIVANASPTANFSANITTACLPATIQFTDASTANAGTLVQWQWDFGDGTTSTLQNPSKTYTTTGFYSVTLTVTSSTGCKRTTARANYIRVVSGVTADFSETPPSTCSGPFLVPFNNLTSGPGTISYQWNFGNSTSSTQPNPIANYASPGTYTVRLTATSQFGCSGSIQKDIIIPAITTQFTAPDTVCLDAPVNFVNNSTPGPQASSWAFGNGQQATTLNGSTVYSAAGTYPVKLINQYSNCIDSVSRSIVVLPKPLIDFSAPNAVACKAPFQINFQDLSPDAVAWQWDFGDGTTANTQNPLHTYTTAGQYNVTLTITNSRGCQNTLTKSSFVQVVAPVVKVANAPAGGCVPFTYSPIHAVTAIDGISSYFWDFGDGSTSTSATPSHVYSSTGVYTLKLVITTTGGCSDSVIYSNGISVGTPPNTNFSASPLDVCAAEGVQFTVQPPTVADTWAWDFGDGGTSSQRDPVHGFTDTGYFSVTLMATNQGCPQAFTINQYIHVKPPVPSFSIQVSCTNKRQVNFINSSQTDPAYGPISYTWSFGDPANSTSVLTNPSFIYPSTDSYTVQLTVTNGSCSNTFSQVVQLNSDIADFSVSKSTVCRNEPVNISSIGSLPQNIAFYRWSFDGGPYTSMGASVVRAFTSNGPHSISLIVEDINGCRDTLTRNPAIQVGGPIVDFVPASTGACNNSTISFNDLSTPVGGVVSWTWDFGDGQSQSYTAPPFNHLYTDTGSFSVRLTIKDANGCTDSYLHPQKVLITKPVARFSALSPLICPASPVQFRDSSSGHGLRYNWDFGDGNTSSLANPTHIYGGSDNNYSIKLVITDSVGCQDSVSRSNYISARAPKPLFNLKDTSTICPPLETSFSFLGQDYESFYWDFGDGVTSTLLNPTHFYNAYGNYQPKLILVGYGGCLDSVTAQSNVYNPSANTSMIYSPLTACNSLLVDYTLRVPPSTRFTFYPGDGSSDNSQNLSFQHLYKTFGFFNPALVLTDSLKCVVSVGGPNQIRILGAEPLFGVDKKAFCDSNTVLFANYTIGNDPVVSRVWDFGDGNTSGIKDPSHRYTQPGTYISSLTVNTQAGCSKTLTDTIRVYATPSPAIFSDTIVCINETLPFTASLVIPDSVTTWNWTFGNGANAAIQSPSTSYSSTGRYPVTLEAKNKLGCAGTVSTSIFVPPTPQITVANNPVIPVSSSVLLPVTYSPNIASYTWSPPYALSCTDCANPTASPKSTTKYQVTATDIYGCSNTNEVTVTVVCNDKNYFVPNTFSPNNDGNNDRFYPRGTGLARVQSMRIYNRMGGLVFERRNFMANDATLGWDGTYKGKKAEMDTYVYVIEFICENSAIIPFKGNVTLIR